MSQRTIVTCDECGTERKDVNHWFSLVASATRPRLVPFDEAHQSPDSGFLLDFCGQRCTLKAIQRWFETGSVSEAIASPTQRPEPRPAQRPDVRQDSRTELRQELRPLAPAPVATNPAPHLVHSANYR